MKYLLSYIFSMVVLMGTAQVHPEEMAVKLRKLGFENIRTEVKDDQLLISLENNVYRDDRDGIITALDTLAAGAAPHMQLSVYWLKNDIPQLQVKVEAGQWLQYRLGQLAGEEMKDHLLIEPTVDNHWQTLKTKAVANSNANKIDLVIYPQLRVGDWVRSQLFEVQFNIAPAMEVSLWKGMLFTGQVIFPLKNDYEILEIKENLDYRKRDFLYTTHEGDYIRPGFVTLSQDIRLADRWFGTLSAGNFNGYRYGVHGLVHHLMKGNRWSVGAHGGYTGSSHFLEGRWITGQINTFTWKTQIGYFYPRYNVQLNLSYGSYVNNDKGFRADCTRYFGRTAIGFYAMVTDGNSNGGFKFTIPFPGAKRHRKHALRIRAPYYFDADYNAGYAIYYGKEFETGPYENQLDNNFQPLFIKNIILNR